MLKTKYIIYILLSIPLLLVILVRKKAFLRHVEWLDLSVTMVSKNRRWTILSLLFTNCARSPETSPFGGGRILHFIFAVNMSPARPDISFLQIYRTYWLSEVTVASTSMRPSPYSWGEGWQRTYISLVVVAYG